MCATCGCGGEPQDHGHDHGEHHHHQGHDHHHHHDRVVRVEEDVLAKNSRIAERNRGWLAARRVLALNLVSSPGAGKTSLLERTLRESGFPATVIEGDQATERDADRIRAAGVRAVQVNTGTLQVASGATFGNFNAGTLTGGTYRVLTNGTFDTQGRCPSSIRTRARSSSSRTSATWSAPRSSISVSEPRCWSHR